MLLVGQLLEIAGDRRSLSHQGVDLLADHRDQVEDTCRQQPRQDAVEDQDRQHPGNAAPFRRIDRRVEDQGQDRSQNERAEDAPDRNGKDQRQRGQHGKEDEGAEIPASPQLFDPATLNHRGIIACSNEKFEPGHALQMWAGPLPGGAGTVGRLQRRLTLTAPDDEPGNAASHQQIADADQGGMAPDARDGKDIAEEP